MPFCWVHEEMAPPFVLDESLPSLPFLSHCTIPELYDYLDRFQDMHHATTGHASTASVAPPLPVPDLMMPEGSGKRRR